MATPRGLSPDYADHLPVRLIAGPGSLVASDHDLARLSTAFAGPPHWMADSF